MPLMPVAVIQAQLASFVQLYDNIASGAIASWDVTGIPQTYNHLRIVLNARGDTAATLTETHARFNGDSSAIYDAQYLLTSNTTIVAAATAALNKAQTGEIPAASATADKAGTVVSVIADYKSTTFQKTIISDHGAMLDQTTAMRRAMNYGLWRSTAAINQITVLPTAGNFIAGSRLTIYGLL
jgi:hypothetical protein